jgi:transposase
VISEKTLLVGVDAGEKVYDVVILHPASDYRSDFTVGVKKDNRDEIARRICKSAKKIASTDIRVTVESSTSASHILSKHLTNYLWPKDLNVKTNLISSVTPRKLAEAQLIDTKTDRIDSYLTAQCGAYEHLPRVKRTDERLKSLSSTYEFLSKQSASLKMRIRSLLLQLNPSLTAEFKRAHKDKLSLVVISSYEAYMQYGKLTDERLEKVLKEESFNMGKKKRKKLLGIINEETITDSLYLVNIIREHRTLLSIVEKQLDPLKEVIKAAGIKSPTVKLLTSIPGIAEFTASMFVGLVQDVERFPSSKEFIGYIGTYPVKVESGKLKGKTKMSKKGIKVLKRLLYTSAMSAINSNKYVERIANKAVSRGKTDMQAIGVVMTCLVKWIYGVWKSGEAWKQEKRGREMGNSRNIFPRAS